MATDRGPEGNFVMPVAWGFGAVYLAIGILGFFITGFDDWLASNTMEYLLWFEINPLHNVVHILIGGALLAAASAGFMQARGALLAIGVTYLLVGIIGFFATGQEWNILSLNTADNWLHIGTAIITLGAVMQSGTSHADSRVPA